MCASNCLEFMRAMFKVVLSTYRSSRGRGVALALALRLYRLMRWLCGCSYFRTAKVVPKRLLRLEGTAASTKVAQHLVLTAASHL